MLRLFMFLTVCNGTEPGVCNSYIVPMEEGTSIQRCHSEIGKIGNTLSDGYLVTAFACFYRIADEKTADNE